MLCEKQDDRGGLKANHCEGGERVFSLLEWLGLSVKQRGGGMEKKGRLPAVKSLGGKGKFYGQTGFIKSLQRNLAAFRGRLARGAKSGG